MTHDEDRFNETIGRLAREHDPVEVPREELWARIDAVRQARRVAPATGGSDTPVIPLAERAARRARPQYLRWAAALAAMLVLGIALGRLTERGTGTGGIPLASAERDSAAAMLPYRLATMQHLSKTEALLASLASDAASGETDQVAGWAGELLTDTRLLLDSPAGRDVELKKLLEDLELVLAQIADLQAGRAGDDVEMIQDGINQRDVLLRLRAATARPNLAGS